MKKKYLLAREQVESPQPCRYLKKHVCLHLKNNLISGSSPKEILPKSLQKMCNRGTPLVGNIFDVLLLEMIFERWHRLGGILFTNSNTLVIVALTQVGQRPGGIFQVFRVVQNHISGFDELCKRRTR